jgi:glycosyltransferase involved in cell wall biosynthesis
LGLKNQNILIKAVNSVPTASIIIPIYNAEKYIERCLDSILRQTFKDFEVLCIDDGSNDASYQLLQEYRHKFPEIIKVYTQVNSGTGKTRNNGMRYSTGKYLFFIDNDDYIAEDYIQTYVEAAEKYGADMVIGGYRRVDEYGKDVYRNKIKSDAVWEPFKRLAPWGRVYRRDFMTENKLEFLDCEIGEDNYLNIIAATVSSKTKVIDYIGYYWFYNRKSISNTQYLNSKLEQSAVYMLKSIYNKLDLPSVNMEKQVCIEYLFIKLVIFYLLFYGRRLQSKNLISAYSVWFSTLKEFFPGYRKNPLIGIFTPVGENQLTRFTVSFFILLDRLRLAGAFLNVYSRI